MKKILVIIAPIVAFCLGFAYSNSMTVLPKDVITISHISRLELAIKDFAKQKGRLPVNLDEIVTADLIKEQVCKDGWGCEFEYQISDCGNVSLVSYCGRMPRTEPNGIEAEIRNDFIVTSFRMP